LSIDDKGIRVLGYKAQDFSFNISYSMFNISYSAIKPSSHQTIEPFSHQAIKPLNH